MPSTIVGVLLERHPDHIVLANGTQIFLEEGMTANLLPIGATLTILCTPQADKKLAHYIRVNPDWLLDSLEVLAAGPDDPAPLADRGRCQSMDEAVSPRTRRGSRRRDPQSPPIGLS
jgi:hypothetical protein